MPTLLSRIIAFVLVPCFIVDPVFSAPFAAAPSAANFEPSHQTTLMVNELFRREALEAGLAYFTSSLDVLARLKDIRYQRFLRQDVRNPYRLAALLLKPLFDSRNRKTPRWLIAAYTAFWIAPILEADAILDARTFKSIHVDKNVFQTGFRWFVGFAARMAYTVFGKSRLAAGVVHSILGGAIGLPLRTPAVGTRQPNPSSIIDQIASELQNLNLSWRLELIRTSRAGGLSNTIFWRIGNELPTTDIETVETFYAEHRQALIERVFEPLIAAVVDVLVADTGATSLDPLNQLRTNTRTGGLTHSVYWDIANKIGTTDRDEAETFYAYFRNTLIARLSDRVTPAGVQGRSGTESEDANVQRVRPATPTPRVFKIIDSRESNWRNTFTYKPTVQEDGTVVLEKGALYTDIKQFPLANIRESCRSVFKFVSLKTGKESGSAYLTSRGVMTALHVYRDSLSYDELDQWALKDNEGHIFPLTGVKVLTEFTRETSDTLVLSVPRDLDEYPRLEMAAEPKPGAAVFAVGYPYKGSGPNPLTISVGNMATSEEQKVVGSDPYLGYSDAAIEGGHSGGLIIDEFGKAVGIITSLIGTGGLRFERHARLSRLGQPPLQEYLDHLRDERVRIEAGTLGLADLDAANYFVKYSGFPYFEDKGGRLLFDYETMSLTAPADYPSRQPESARQDSAVRPRGPVHAPQPTKAEPIKSSDKEEGFIPEQPGGIGLEYEWRDTGVSSRLGTMTIREIIRDFNRRVRRGSGQRQLISEQNLQNGLAQQDLMVLEEIRRRASTESNEIKATDSSAVGDIWVVNNQEVFVVYEVASNGGLTFAYSPLNLRPDDARLAALASINFPQQSRIQRFRPSPSGRGSSPVVLNSNGAYQMEQFLALHPMLEAAVSFVTGLSLIWGALSAAGIHSTLGIIISALSVGYLVLRPWIKQSWNSFLRRSSVDPFIRDVVAAA